MIELSHTALFPEPKPQLLKMEKEQKAVA